MEINSKEYWNYRFISDWQLNHGSEQTRFFTEIAIEMFPSWLSAWIENNATELCDWGCALGDAVPPLAARFPSLRITGVDISEEAITFASQAHPDAHFMVENWLSGEAAKVYDVVFSSNTLEHFENPWMVAGRIAARASKFLILMLPFREIHRISEHLATIDPGSIPYTLNEGSFVLMHSSVDETLHRTPSYWPGEQILLIYGNSNFIPQLNLYAGSVVINSSDQKVLAEKLSKAEAELESLKQLENKLNQKLEQATLTAQQLKLDREKLQNEQGQTKLTEHQLERNSDKLQHDQEQVVLARHQLELDRAKLQHDQEQVALARHQLELDSEKLRYDQEQKKRDDDDKSQLQLNQLRSIKDADIAYLNLQLKQIQESLSWRITAPLRLLNSKITAAKFLFRKTWIAYRIGGIKSVLRKACDLIVRKNQSWFFLNSTHNHIDANRIIHSINELNFETSPWDRTNKNSPGVIMYVNDFFDGGLERVVIDLCLEMKKRGIAAWILVASSGGRAIQEAKSLGIWVEECQGKTEKIKKALKSYPSNIIMTHHCYDNFDIFSSCQLPIVEVLHNAYFWHKDNQHIFSARKKITRFIAVSKSVSNYSADYLGISPSNITVINNGLNPVGLMRPPQRLRARLKEIKNGNIRIVFLASFGPQKRHILVLKAFNKIAEKYPGAQLILAGSPEVNIDVYRRVKETAEQSLFAEKIIFSGTLNRKQISKLLSQAHIALLPSSVEGFSIASLEFAYFGLPCVMSDTGSAKDFLERYGHGLISESAAIPHANLSPDTITKACFEAEGNEVNQLVESIIKLLDNYDYFGNMANTASEHWQEYSMSVTAEQYEDFLAEHFNLKGARQ